LIKVHYLWPVSLFYYYIFLMNIYLGNLNFQTKEEEIQELFQTYGEVTEVKIIKDRYTGRARGFAFVEMENEEAGAKAIEELNETEFQGRKILVNKARERRDSGS